MDKQAYDEMREKEENEKTKAARNQKIKKYAKSFLWAIGIILVLGGGGWYLAQSGFFAYDPLNLCVQHTGVGMHIHPNLKIVKGGEEIKIPANIGISPSCMKPIHTHDDSGTLHVEFPNRTEVPFGSFFKVWEKPLNDFGINPKMRVNSADNNELENYIMRDGDKIELFFD